MTNYPPAPPPGYAELSVFADVVMVYCPEDPELSKQGRGVSVRGSVTEFSRKSRQRMMQKLAKMRDLTIGLFVTLTYPDNFPKEPEDWHRDLKVFLQRLQRLSFQSFGMWRLELKPRLSGEYEGWLAPHFHLLIFPVNPLKMPEIDVFRAWLTVAWYDVAHENDQYQGVAGTQAREIESRRHAAAYCSKYAAKTEDQFSIIGDVGRHWGVWGDMDISEFLRVWISPSQLVNFKRVVRKWLRAKGTSASRSYAKKMSRSPPHVGLSVFGLGDSSQQAFEHAFTATIIQMIQVCHQTPN